MDLHKTIAMRHITPVFLAIGFLCTVALSSWAQTASQTISYREFLQSLTPAERKLPTGLVAAERYANGQPLPASLEARASSLARSASSEKVAYRIDGIGTDALLFALASLGIYPKFVSTSRPYLTAYLSPSSAVALAQSDAVFKITMVLGPKAQGQGSTQAAAAHRLNDLYPINQPDMGDPVLDGSGVVIGLISLPFKQADFDVLEAETTRIIPAGAALHVRTGGDAVSHDSGALDAVDNTGGSLDALYLLQLIYDMAPDAQVVVASPGVNSVPGEVATIVTALVTGDSGAGIPAADIIIDDLFYADQNPFEIDEIGEAVTAAREAGVLYVTAAGDHGQGGTSPNSSVYISDFEGIQAPADLVAIDPFLEGYYVQSFGGDGILSVTEDLDNLCVFWSERPSSSGAPPRFIAWIYDDSDNLVGDLGVSAPGGCTGTGVSTGYKVVFDQGNSAISGYRLMVTGVRNLPADLAYSDTIFDTVTSGNIRGHAASPDALTVAASELCVDGALSAYAGCSALSIAPYSSDGEAVGTARFFWQGDGDGGYQEIDGGLTVSKPDLTAAGKTMLTSVSSGAAVQNNYYGTSAASATTAGIAALYWEYAEGTLGIHADFIAEAVRDLFGRATLDAGDTGFDPLFGAGLLDAPKPLDDGSNIALVTRPRVSVALTAKAAGATLQFGAALPADNGATYVATCTDDGNPITAWTDQPVDPGTAYVVQSTPEAEVSCTVTGSVDNNAGDTLVETDIAAVTALAVSETAVVFRSDIDEIGIFWSTDPNIARDDMLVVTLTCTVTSSGVVVVDSVELDESPYRVEAEGIKSLDCVVTTTLSVNGAAATALGDPSSGTVIPDEASGLPLWLLYQATQ